MFFCLTWTWTMLSYHWRVWPQVSHLRWGNTPEPTSTTSTRQLSLFNRWTEWTEWTVPMSHGSFGSILDQRSMNFWGPCCWLSTISICCLALQTENGVSLCSLLLVRLSAFCAIFCNFSLWNCIVCDYVLQWTSSVPWLMPVQRYLKFFEALRSHIKSGTLQFRSQLQVSHAQGSGYMIDFWFERHSNCRV